MRKALTFFLVLLLSLSLLSFLPQVYAETFGNTGEGTTADAQDANQITIGFFTLAEAGEVSKITAKCNRASSGNMQCAIYTKSGGLPVVRKGITQETVVGTGFAKYDFTFSSSVSLPAGTYGLCIWSAAAYNIYYDDGSSGDGMDDDSQTYNNWADPWGGTTNRDRARVYCIYATYTPTGGEEPVYLTCEPSETIAVTAGFTATKLIHMSSAQTTVITTEQGAVKSVYMATQETAQPAIDLAVRKLLYFTQSATSSVTATITITKILYAISVEIFDSAIVSALAECTKFIAISILDITLWDITIPLAQLFATYPFIEIPLTAEEAAAIAIVFSIIAICVAFAVCVVFTRAKRQQ